MRPHDDVQYAAASIGAGGRERGERFDVLRLEVTPARASQMESFAIYFPMVLRDEAVLQLHWGTTAVPLRIKAPSV